MGTHPIFESDFDCLTDWTKTDQKMAIQKVSELRGKSKDELTKQLNDFKQELNNLRCQGQRLRCPIQAWPHPRCSQVHLPHLDRHQPDPEGCCPQALPGQEIQAS